jgi:hypothetical protein
VAAGIISNGQLVRGARGFAGEFGHIPVHADGALRACGRHGCLEAYVSASALVRRYRRTGGISHNAADITARLDIDPDAAGPWAEGTDALGRALVTSTVPLDPQRIVLAGGMTAAGEALTALSNALCSADSPGAPHRSSASRHWARMRDSLERPRGRRTPQCFRPPSMAARKPPRRDSTRPANRLPSGSNGVAPQAPGPRMKGAGHRVASQTKPETSPAATARAR